MSIHHGNEYINLENRLLCDILFQSKYKTLKDKFRDLETFVIVKTNCPNESLNRISVELRNFKSQFTLKWDRSGRNKERFLQAEKSWLDSIRQFTIYQNTKGGRPPIDFQSSSERSKRRKTAELRDSHSSEELAYAAQMKLRASGKRKEAIVINDLLKVDKPEVKSNKNRQLSIEQALSLLIEAQLSRKQYNVIRNYAMDVFPSYKKVKKAKQECYPQAISISDADDDSIAEVPIQKLLDHTISRLMHVQQDVIAPLDFCHNLTLISKWGFDGSSSHTQYMQKFLSEESDDKYMFLSSLVPLRLTCEKDGQNLVVWQNPRPSSPRYCRPIKLQYKKETLELTKQEKSNIDKQINELSSSRVLLKEKEYLVTHTPVFTMVDGKICNSISDTKSTLKCYLCGATSKDFNNLDDMLNMPIREEYLTFGISVLHCWIRMFESLLHIAYKIPVKSWRISKEKTSQVEENKKIIQAEFKAQMSLIVDRPKPGFGNTNDGNVSRNFFQNSELSASITGINKELIYRFYIILQTLSGGFTIDITKFKSYCFETAKLYVDNYPWHPMTTSVHKILLHGDKIISSALLPIGQLSEEAQEARNKDFKQYREHFSRKTSRKDNLTDVFNRLLISSDPIITSLRPLPSLNRKQFSPEVIEMLIPDSVCSFNESANSNLSVSDSSEDGY